MSFAIEWETPKRSGATLWRREWRIPHSLCPGFFAFWQRNRFKLKTEGFGVRKDGDIWIFSETKASPALFKHFANESQTASKEQPEEEPALPEYIVRDPSGLRPWQIPSVAKLCAAIQRHGAALDGSDLGAGKSYVACAVARELNLKIAIVCPKAVKEAWRRVICDHFGMKSKLVDIVNYEQLRIGKKECKLASYVTNRKTHRDIFTWKISKDTLIVWDESQKLKNWKTKNAKTCIDALKQGYKMLFCSATNATNPLEMRAVGTALKLFKGAKQYYEWAYAHGVYKGRWGMVFTDNKKEREQFLKKIHHDIFHTRGSRLTRDTIPGFPECEIIADCYNMDDEDIKQINQVYNEMAIELKQLEKKSKRDKAAELTALIRARQKTELLKVPLFIDMIEDALENGMRVVVYVNFTETIHALSTRLNTKCIFDGKTNEVVRQRNVDLFQENKEPVILVNMASGGAGLGLQDLDGNYPRLALISPNYSAMQMRQVTGRVWRDGGKSKSIQKIVFVEGTVETQVCEIVKTKLDNLDLLNDGNWTPSALSILNSNQDTTTSTI
jgi:superfamily II DNA or RNA helicase